MRLAYFCERSLISLLTWVWFTYLLPSEVYPISKAIFFSGAATCHGFVQYDLPSRKYWWRAWHWVGNRLSRIYRFALSKFNIYYWRVLRLCWRRRASICATSIANSIQRRICLSSYIIICGDEHLSCESPDSTAVPFHGAAAISEVLGTDADAAGGVDQAHDKFPLHSSIIASASQYHD